MSASIRRLPEQPSLEQLRKQAKELLQELRAGVPSAIAEVNQFERNPDSSIFALSDAQRVIARAYGFASWPKLKAFVEGANIARFADAVQAGDVAQVRTLLASRPEWSQPTGPRATSIGDCITRCCGAMPRWFAFSWRRVQTPAKEYGRIATPPLR